MHSGLQERRLKPEGGLDVYSEAITLYIHTAVRSTSSEYDTTPWYV